mgnify:CR=1 FL=1
MLPIATTPTPQAADLPVYACIKTHVRAAELFAGWPRARVLEIAAGSGAFAHRLVEM